MLRLAAVVCAVVVAVPAAAAPKKAKDRSLGEGRYVARVAALVCSSCADEVERTLKGFKELDDVKVEQASSSVSFAVKPGAKVGMASLQKSLKAAAAKMGMGADYTLKDVKAVKG